MLRSLFLTAGLALALPLRAAEPAPALAALTYSGDQAALDALDADIRTAGRDAAQLAALEQRLLAILARRDTTFAARQAVAQRLARVLSAAPGRDAAAAFKPLAAMLADERDSDLARLALEPVPGDAVDRLFVATLATASGRARLGVIDALGRRRVMSAVGPLTALLRGDDAVTARAAAAALGDIGSAGALAGLRSAPAHAAEAAAHALLAVAARQPAADAGKLLLELEIDPRTTAPVRLAAFRTSLDLDPATAASRLVGALGGTDSAKKAVALEAIAASRAPGLVAALAAGLAGWDAATQTAVLAAFARRGDAAAVPAVVAATKHTDAEVRRAALNALGFLPGSPDLAALLAGVAAGTDSDDARIARASLARLNGPGVSAALLAGAERGTAALRAAYLDVLALRGMTEALPLLFACRTDADAAVRIAALAALGELAPVADQRKLLDWTLAATDEAEQTRALRSLVSVILRDPAADTRGKLLFDTIENAAPAVALRLLPALSRLGGSASADCAGRLALKADAALADAAVAALARWPDRTALAALALAAEKGGTASAREAALAAALRHFERYRDTWTPATTGHVAQLLRATSAPAARLTLLGVLHRASDAAALALAESFKTDPALAAAAGTAAEIIRANQAGPVRFRVSEGSGNPRNMTDGDTDTRWNAETDGAEWFEIDFRVSRPLHTLTLDQTGRANEFPERYAVHVTDDPANPGPAVATGAGTATRTVIALPAGTRGRYAIVKNTAARADGQWAVVELYVD